jgi:hypothetical protein
MTRVFVFVVLLQEKHVNIVETMTRLTRKHVNIVETMTRLTRKLV